MSLISSLKCLLWLALMIWCSALWVKTINSWFLSQWTFLFGSSFCVGLHLLQDWTKFFLYSNTYPTMGFNLAQLETYLSVLASTSSTIWIALPFAFLFNSTSSFNDPMLQSLLEQSGSTCRKNDGPWNQRLLDVTFLGPSPCEASLAEFLCLRHSATDQPYYFL